MGTPSLIVVAPNGHRTRVEITQIPFRIGRQADNDLVIRDSRASRNHARILFEEGCYAIEDAGSRHGLYVNGRRVQRHRLASGDRIELGVTDSYQLFFTPEGAEMTRMVETVGASSNVPVGAGSNLGRLKAVLEIARTLQTSYTLNDVLNSVVDAALAVTGAERGFLLLKDGQELEMRCARDCSCHQLGEDALRVPRRVIQQALQNRQELLSMRFDHQASAAAHTHGQTVAELELRSVICVPLVRISASSETDTATLKEQTAGLIYMDSRFNPAEIGAGDRELLQSLAIEASVIIENARLLEEERQKKKIEEELGVARRIQQDLLPRTLPQSGWFTASGSSTASLQVGGDYFDVMALDDENWGALVADVSGKGVSSALVASLLQGAFLSMAGSQEPMERRIARINRFLSERSQGEKYATLFFAALGKDGGVRYINAGHCQPFLVVPGGRATYLESTGMPVGLVEEAEFSIESLRLNPGEKIVIYSDGVTDAEDVSGQPFGRGRLREVIERHSANPSSELHAAIQEAVAVFTEGAQQADDITVLVLEYRGAATSDHPTPDAPSSTTFPA